MLGDEGLLLGVGNQYWLSPFKSSGIQLYVSGGVMSDRDTGSDAV